MTGRWRWPSARRWGAGALGRWGRWQGQCAPSGADLVLAGGHCQCRFFRGAGCHLAVLAAGGWFQRLGAAAFSISLGDVRSGGCSLFDHYSGRDSTGSALAEDPGRSELVAIRYGLEEDQYANYLYRVLPERGDLR